MLQSPRLLTEIQFEMSKVKNITWLVCICISLLACAVVAHGQSGRRQQRVEPAAPIPSPTPEPTPPPKTERKDPDLIIVVGAERNGGFSYYPYAYFDAAIEGCSEALSKNSAARVDPTNNSLNRGDAIKRAKSDSKTYVVLLQLSAETAGGAATTNSVNAQIEVGYTVFAPGTAKVVTSGRTFPGTNRAGPVVVGPTGGGSSSVVYQEQLLKRAGEDAGDRILHSLHLDTIKTN
jgi:hypothetical protein